MTKRFVAECAEGSFFRAFLESPIGTLPVPGVREADNSVRKAKTRELVRVELGPVVPQKPGRVWLTNVREDKNRK